MVKNVVSKEEACEFDFIAIKKIHCDKKKLEI